MQKLSHEYTINKEKSQDSNPDFASELGIPGGSALTDLQTQRQGPGTK